MKHHQKFTHDLLEEDRKCSICNKIFLSLDGLLKHKKNSRHGTYECKECQMVSVGDKSQQRHLLMHNPSRRFLCNVCKYRFPNQNKLTRHIQIHAKAI